MVRCNGRYSRERNSWLRLMLGPCANNALRNERGRSVSSSRFLLESPEKNRVDPEAGIVFLSPIFDWYRGDFPEGRAALGTYLSRIHPPGVQRDFLRRGQFRIQYTDYDWSLNKG